MVDQPDLTQGRTIAASHKGVLVDDLAYDLRGTPCEHVVGGKFVHHATEVQRAFPTDLWLADMGIDSYMGMPLFGSGGTPLGLIALLHTSPIPRAGQAETILKVVTARVAAELEREMAQQDCATASTASRDLESSLDGVVSSSKRADPRVQCRAEAMFGRRREHVTA